MEKVQKPSYTPSSEPFRIYIFYVIKMLFYIHVTEDVQNQIIWIDICHLSKLNLIMG
jgi:hypothetical protein